MLSDNKGFKTGFIFMGTVLGAGFASGQEIMRFFCRYGFMGLLGIFFAAMMFFLTGYGILKITYINDTKNSGEFLHFIMGKKPAAAFDFISFAFLLLMLAAMLAGGAEAIKSLVGINSKSASLILAFLIFFVFISGNESIGKINTILCPALILSSVILSACITSNDKSGFNYLSFKGTNEKGAFLSAFVYVSFNIITALPVLCSSSAAKNKASALKAALTGSLGLLAIALFLYMCMSRKFDALCQNPIPMLVLSKQVGSIFCAVYFFLFFGAVFTTAIGCGFGILNRLNGFGINSISCVIIMITSALILSQLGFSRLVSDIYPVFGFIGAVEIFCIIKKAFFD